jgi:inhibitor of cysteine peptidase
VKVGDLVTVSLKGNPTTGYGWQTAKLDGKTIEQSGEPKYTTEAHRPGMVGVGGTFVFQFKAVKVGKTELNLQYARPWEKGKKPAMTFAATIEVEAK